MSYVHQLRHRNLRKMDSENGNMVVARDPQRQDTNTRENGNSRSNTKNDATSAPKTQTTDLPFSSLFTVEFVTASPTFTDEIVGWTTLTPPAAEPTEDVTVTYVFTEPQSIEASSTEYSWTPVSSSEVVAETVVEASPPTSQQAAVSSVSSTTIPEVVLNPSSTTPLSPLPTSMVMATSSSTLTSSYVSYSRSTRSLSSMTSSSTATGEAEASTSAGMTTGGKAGLAVGIIMVIGVVAGGLLWFFWRKKKGSRPWKKANKEKTGFGSATGAMRINSFDTAAEKKDNSAPAPRLSLRPVTQFIPDLASAKKRLSQGNPLNMINKPAGMAAVGAGRNLTPNKPGGSPWERQIGGERGPNPFKDSVHPINPANPVNPFGDQAKAAGPPNVTVTPPMSDDGSSMNGTAGVAVGAAAGAVGAAVAVGAARDGNGQSRNAPGGPQGAPVAAAGPPSGNVHRVQLDFKPSMEDELELCAGQLVRLLHEYDDGWVCCYPILFIS